jgi:hypothetical protein
MVMRTVLRIHGHGSKPIKDPIKACVYIIRLFLLIGFRIGTKVVIVKNKN